MGTGVAHSSGEDRRWSDSERQNGAEHNIGSSNRSGGGSNRCSGAEDGTFADGKEEATPDGGDVQSDTKGRGDVVGDNDVWVEVFTSALRTRETMIQGDGDLICSDDEDGRAIGGAPPPEVDVTKHPPYRLSGGSRQSRGAEGGAFVKEEGDETTRSSSGATSLKPWQSTSRKPWQSRDGEIHRVMVPAAAILTAVFPWNRTKETLVLKLIEEEDDAGDDRKLKEGAAAIGGVRFLVYHSDEAPIGRRSCEEVGLGFSLNLGQLQLFVSAQFCLLFLDGLKFFQWDPGGNFYFLSSRLVEIK